MKLFKKAEKAIDDVKDVTKKTVDNVNTVLDSTDTAIKTLMVGVTLAVAFSIGANFLSIRANHKIASKPQIVINSLYLGGKTK